MNKFMNCGWGRILYGPAYDNADQLAKDMLTTKQRKRDIAFFLQAEDAQKIPQANDQLYINTAYAYRLELSEYTPQDDLLPLTVHQVQSAEELALLNRLYQLNHRCDFQNSDLTKLLKTNGLKYLVAEENGELVGDVTYIDHAPCGWDHDSCSIWALTIHPNKLDQGIGRRLIREVVKIAENSGKTYLDLSVQHENARAIALYEKLGFKRTNHLSIKNKSQR